MRKNILVLLPLLGQPRDAKRIAMLNELGFHVEVAYFEREYHKGRMPDCKCTALGRIEHGKYFQRLIIFLKSLFKLRRMTKGFDLVYSSGPDMAYLSVISLLGLKTPSVMEVGDLREIQFRPGLLGSLVRFIEKILINRCAFVVSTSQGFIDAYYHKIKNNLSYIILENKLEKSAHQEAEVRPGGSTIRIGYFGVLRCNWSWQVLSTLAKRNPEKFEVFVAGYNLSIDGFEQSIKDWPNIKYHGTYKSPEDLHMLYSQVDLVWGVYPVPTRPSDQNWKWAKTNRFYESLFFKRPMIVLESSGDSRAVESLEAGLSISKGDVDDAVAYLEGLDAEQVLQLQQNTRLVPENVYVYDNEYQLFKNKMLSAIAYH